MAQGVVHGGVFRCSHMRVCCCVAHHLFRNPWPRSKQSACRGEQAFYFHLQACLFLLHTPTLKLIAHIGTPSEANTVLFRIPYRIAKLARACKRMYLAFARTCTVSRGGPRGGQSGKGFHPQKHAAPSSHYTTCGVRPAPVLPGPGLDSTLGTF